jgi:ABC-type multidrug transport system fused ATPase/permease subunit
LSARKGNKIAFVGPSGCGKSTLVGLLQRFYDYEGQILVDGIELRDYDLHHVRHHFVAVNQEPSLFTGTVAQNIRYNAEVSDEQVHKAADWGEATKFVM